jgi:RNA polymerase sigma-70 factor (ECF subfamily)
MVIGSGTISVLSDAQLVGQVRRGDAESYGALCRRYERSVLAVALAELRDIHAAEDVAQATLLAGFQRLSTLNSPSKFGPWILQITRRQVVDWTRKRQLSAAAVGVGSRQRQTGDKADIDWIGKEHLLKLVGRLPERERVLVGLRFFEGHSVAEISEITARPVGTVTKQLSRAISRLRAAFDKENLP